MSSPRLTRSEDPQMPPVPCQFFGQPADRCYNADGEPERIATFGQVEAAVSMHLESSDHLATPSALLGPPICKV